MHKALAVKSKPTYEALPGLLWRQLYEPGPAKEEAKEVGADVVAVDERDREQEPDEALQHVGDHQAGGGRDHKQGDVRVREQRELFEVVGAFEGHLSHTESLL